MFDGGCGTVRVTVDGQTKVLSWFDHVKLLDQLQREAAALPPDAMVTVIGVDCTRTTITAARYQAMVDGARAAAEAAAQLAAPPPDPAPTPLPAVPDEAEAAELERLRREAVAELGRQGAAHDGALAVLVAEIPGVGMAHGQRFPAGHAVASAENRLVLAMPGGHDPALELPPDETTVRRTYRQLGDLGKRWSSEPAEAPFKALVELVQTLRALGGEPEGRMVLVSNQPLSASAVTALDSVAGEFPRVRVTFGGDVRGAAGSELRGLKRPRVGPPRPAPAPGPALTGELPEGRFLNRELSFLEYVGRLVGRAEDASVPLLDRVRGLTFVSGGLDDFAQVRMARLEAQAGTKPGKRSVDGLTAGEQLASIQARVDELEAQQRRLWERELLPALRAAGIEVVGVGELSAAERAEVWGQVRPGLRRVEGPSAGFPAAEHLALNVGVVLGAGHGLVELPAGMPRFVGTGTRLVPVEEVVAEHLGELFPGHEVVGHYVYRVTSNRDMRVDEGPVSDLLSAMRDALEEFPKTAGPVRLEIGEEAPAAVREELARSLGLTPREVTVSPGRVNLGDVGAIAGLERPELKSAPVRGVTPGALRDAGSVMEAMSNGDILLQHPYESFAESVVRFLQEASADPDVTEIRMTVYRTSSESPIVRALIDAAKAGKQVDVLVELRARGDNAANVRWIGELERAGARVTQGVMGLKTHAKVLQVARRVGDELRTFTHLGTGNYNPSTARFYEDLGLLTANPEIGADVSELFGMLTGHGEGGGFRKLLVAPQAIRTGVIEQIRQEAAAGKDGRIVLKVNNLLDPGVIDALYDASRAGAQVDVIVRGMTALAPGVPDQSENVRVRSVIGGVLEHSRVFLFGTPERGTRAWIGSADMMNRNLSGRVEVLTPVEDPVLRGRLEKIVELALADDVQSWSLEPDGSWRPVPAVAGFDAQRELQRLAALPFTDAEIDQARGAVRRDLRDAKRTLSALPPLPLLPGGQQALARYQRGQADAQQRLSDAVDRLLELDELARRPVEELRTRVGAFVRSYLQAHAGGPADQLPRLRQDAELALAEAEAAIGRAGRRARRDAWVRQRLDDLVQASGRLPAALRPPALELARAQLGQGHPAGVQRELREALAWNRELVRLLDALPDPAPVQAPASAAGTPVARPAVAAGDALLDARVRLLQGLSGHPWLAGHLDQILEHAGRPGAGRHTIEQLRELTGAAGTRDVHTVHLGQVVGQLWPGEDLAATPGIRTVRHDFSVDQGSADLSIRHVEPSAPTWWRQARFVELSNLHVAVDEAKELALQGGTVSVALPHVPISVQALNVRWEWWDKTTTDTALSGARLVAGAVQHADGHWTAIEGAVPPDDVATKTSDVTEWDLVTSAGFATPQLSASPLLIAMRFGRDAGGRPFLESQLRMRLELANVLPLEGTLPKAQVPGTPVSVAAQQGPYPVARAEVRGPKKMHPISEALAQAIDATREAAMAGDLGAIAESGLGALVVPVMVAIAVAAHRASPLAPAPAVQPAPAAPAPSPPRGAGGSAGDWRFRKLAPFEHGGGSPTSTAREAGARRAEVAVDANIVMRAMNSPEGLAAVDAQLAGRAPVVSPQALREFARRDDPARLQEWLAQRGGRTGAQPEPADVGTLMAEGVAYNLTPGRVRGPIVNDGDAQVLASALQDGLPVLTDDAGFASFMNRGGYSHEVLDPGRAAPAPASGGLRTTPQTLADAELWARSRQSIRGPRQVDEEGGPAIPEAERPPTHLAKRPFEERHGRDGSASGPGLDAPRLAARDAAPERRIPTLDELSEPFSTMNDKVAMFIAATRLTDLPPADLAGRRAEAEAAISAMRDAVRDAPFGTDCTGAAVAAMRATLQTSDVLVHLLGQ